MNYAYIRDVGGVASELQKEGIANYSDNRKLIRVTYFEEKSNVGVATASNGHYSHGDNDGDSSTIDELILTLKKLDNLVIYDLSILDTDPEKILDRMSTIVEKGCSLHIVSTNKQLMTSSNFVVFKSGFQMAIEMFANNNKLFLQGDRSYNSINELVDHSSSSQRFSSHSFQKAIGQTNAYSPSARHNGKYQESNGHLHHVRHQHTTHADTAVSPEEKATKSKAGRKKGSFSSKLDRFYDEIVDYRTKRVSIASLSKIYGVGYTTMYSFCKHRSLL